MIHPRRALLSVFALIVLVVFPSTTGAQGLVGYWPFTGNASDASSNGNGGTVYNATLTADRFGNANSAYYFNGTNAYIQVPHSTVFDFDSVGEITVTAWVKFCANQPQTGTSASGTSGGFGPWIVGMGRLTYSNNSSDSGFAIYVGFLTRAFGTIVSFDYSTSGGPSNTVVNDGRWHLLAFVLKDTAQRSEHHMNADGVGGTFTITSNGHIYSRAAPLVIGRDPTYNIYFQGLIDDIRIYNRRLYAGELDSLYRLGGWPNVTLPQIGVTEQARTSATICRGDSVQLEAQGSGPFTRYRWRPTTGLSNDTARIVWVRPSTTTTYKVWVYGSPPCPDSVSASVTVTVNQPPVLTLDSNLFACRGQTIQLGAKATGSSPFQYSWTPAASLDNPSIARPKATPSVTTRYTVVVTDANGCRTTDSVLATIYDLPKADAGRDTVICQGNVITLGTPGVTENRYAWSPLAGLNNGLVAQPLAFTYTTTTYILTVTSPKGCQSFDTMVVKVNPVPTVDAGANVTVCADSSAVIGTPAVADYSYRWTPTYGLSNALTAQPVVKPVATTTYHLVATNSDGCTSEDTVRVTVIRPKFTISPSSLDFGTLDDCTSSKELAVELTNTGDAAISISEVLIDNPRFTIVGPTRPIMLAVGAKVSVIVRYAPTASGAISGKLTITGSPCSLSATVNLKGNKQQSDVSADISSLDFGRSLLCQSIDSTQEITISNRGTSDATIGAESIVAPFSIVGSQLPVTIKAGQVLKIRVRYAPGGNGSYSSDLSFPYSSGSCSDTIRVVLSGLVEQPQLASETMLDFGRHDGCDVTHDTTITLTNSSSAYAITVDSVIVPAGFRFMEALPLVIPAGESRTMTMQFRPTAIGASSGTLVMHYSPCSGQLSMTLSGSVEKYELAGVAAIDFGSLIGCDSGHDTTMTLTNSGPYAMTLDSTLVPAGFKVMTGLPLIIPAGKTATISLRFDPQASGSSSGTLRLYYSPCGGELVTALSGMKQGVSFSLPDSINLGEVFSCREQSTSVSAGIIYSGDGGTGSVGSVSISGPFTTTLKAGDVLNSGTPLSFDVTFVPTQDGSATGFIDVTLEPCGITRRIELRGSYWSIALVPSSITFGTQPVGTSTSRPVLFINNSSIPMRIEQVEGIAPPFSIASTLPAVPATLPPGDTLHILVSYQATSGTSRDTLQADVTAPCSIVVNATLEGTGEEDATATVSLPIVEAVPGEHVTLPLTLKSSDGLDALGAQRFTMDVSFNRKLLLPTGATPLGIEQDHERVVTIIGERPAGMSSGELVRLEFIAALGDTTYTPVHIESFRWLDAVAQVRSEDGGVTVKSGGGWKLFLSDGTLRLLIKPNPANQSAEIDYEVIEPGRTRLLVRDAVGREVQRLLDAEVKPGQYNIQHDVSRLAAGAYFYVLETPSGKLVMPLVVVH